MKKLSLVVLFIFNIFSTYAQIQIGNSIVDTTEIYSTLNEPWEILMGADSNLWISEKQGYVSKIDPKTGIKSILLDITNKVWQINESGLLGMVFSPNFKTNSLLYLAYTYTSSSNHYLKIAHYTYNQLLDTLVNEVTIVDSIPANTYHIGCRLKFLSDGTLLITTGDAGNTALSQNKSSLGGKILRVNANGTIPQNSSSGIIYTTGHRNPQGLFITNNFIYSSEHGPSNNDELNIIHPYRNYGWPNVEGPCNTQSEIQFCNDSNVVEPIYSWSPTVATSDILFYNHPAIAEWNNSIILTTLKNQSLIVLHLNSNMDSVINTHTYFSNQWGRIRDVCMGFNGELYLITNGFTRNGNQGHHKIIKIENTIYNSIIKNEALKEIHIYPNPVSNQLFISNSKNGEDLIIVRNVHGQITKEVILAVDGTISLNGIRSGIYYISLYRKGMLMAREKIVKM